MQYVAPAVRITQDYNTGQITVTGCIGIAPDETTIIEYPFRAYEFGYWNKGTARKQAAEMKKRVKAALDSLKSLRMPATQPIEMYERYTR